MSKKINFAYYLNRNLWEKCLLLAREAWEPQPSQKWRSSLMFLTDNAGKPYEGKM